MSMHEVEGYAQEAVIFVNGCDIPADEKVSLIAAVYEWHDNYDTGFTKLREFDILVDTGYFHLFDTKDHPDYEQYKDYFDSISGTGFEFIYDDPIKGYAKDNPLSSYWMGETYRNEKRVSPGRMCCEAGGRVWRHFFPEKPGPLPMSEYAMMRRIADLAADQEDLFMLSELYPMVSLAFWYGMKGEEDKAHYERLKELILTDAVMEEFEAYPYPRMPDEEFDEYDENETYWREWMGYYYDWKRRSPKKVKPEPEPIPGIEAYNKMAMHKDAYESALAEGNIEAALQEFAAFAALDEELGEKFRRANEGRSILEVFAAVRQGPHHEKYANLLPEETDSESLKPFLADYHKWLNGKDDVSYYLNTAQELINAANYTQAFHFITAGLNIDSGNPWLKLYMACVVIFLPLADRIEEQLPVLDGLLDSNFEHKAYLRYLKSLALNGLGRMEEALALMKQAADEDTAYTEAYEWLQGQKK
ncbi:hypothetical protein [Breznakiella homolactica]|uniref:Tetratricopeptide repeat protein n=1 Tax=Breznakiella homolactica TaxID=2798577 RepID=A0A7T7XR43_9SPIR|nr:hypothetical protein [Breznakiella homolactica]QQO10928.1 hypothetical protein JFL75_08425 [Breznakiella homolactica]